MAFENFPTTETAAPTPPPPQQPGKWRNYLMGGLVVALLATWGYILWDKTRTKEIIQQKDAEISTSNSRRDELQKDLEDAAMKYDLIKSSSANMLHSKDSVITKRDREIAAKKEQIRQLLAKANATAEELTQAKNLIASLNGDIDRYKDEVEKLRGEKLVLVQEKETLAKERDKVSRDYDSAQATIKQRDNVIDVASTLHASNFSIIGIQEKGNGKEKTTTTAKRVDKLRISFDIDENRVAQSGLKNIYVCITAPDGTPITGSEKFNTREGQEKFCTQRIEVNYVQGQRQTLSFDWKQNGTFVTGEYKIEVYNNGFKIGEGVRSLKKGGLFS